MIQFITPSLENNKTYKSLVKYNFFEGQTFNKIWRRYLTLAIKNNRVIGEPKLRNKDGEIDVLGIRNNPEIAFNDREIFYNDLLIIRRHSETGPSFFIFKVTMDPKGRKRKIAHLLEGIYASYKANRPHRWIPGRTAIVQDRDKVLVARTKKDGSILTKEHKGLFGINIHDSAGYNNTSLGCTILEKDLPENSYHWKEHFKPLIKSINNKKDIDYTVINKDVILELVKSEYEKKKFDFEHISQFAFRILTNWK